MTFLRLLYLEVMVGMLLGHATKIERIFHELACAADDFRTARELKRNDKILVDPEAGEKVLLQRRDSPFFVPMSYWTYVIAALGLLYAFCPMAD